jgi:hypothetical protein
MANFKAGKNGSLSQGGHTSSTVRGSYTRSEGSGVGFGLSTYSVFDSEGQGMEIDYDRDPSNGNAKESISVNPKRSSTTEKGNSFEIC